MAILQVNWVKGTHKLFVLLQTHNIGTVRLIASCMTKVTSEFPAHGKCCCPETDCCAGSQGSQTSAFIQTVYFAAWLCFSLSWHWIGTIQEVLCNQSGSPKIGDWKIIIWLKHLIEKSSSWLKVPAFELPNPITSLTFLCIFCFVS